MTPGEAQCGKVTIETNRRMFGKSGRWGGRGSRWCWEPAWVSVQREPTLQSTGSGFTALAVTALCKLRTGND